jgi:hypothetical protein
MLFRESTNKFPLKLHLETKTRFRFSRYDDARLFLKLEKIGAITHFRMCSLMV